MALLSHKNLSRQAEASAARGLSLSPSAEAVIGDFRLIRAELERKVKLGELTVKTAREQAERSAARLKADLTRRTKSEGEAAGFYLNRIIETMDARKRSRDTMSLESLQRETNKMLRQLVVEQQIGSRRAEFEARTYDRSVAGGVPAPTLDGLLRFHQESTRLGDEPAREWARRELESFRSRTLNPEDRARIDTATDRPDVVNARLTDRYVEAMRGQDQETLERFVTESLAARDANACTAAFLMAREQEQGTRLRWVRQIMGSLSEFPDAALAAIRAHETEVRAAQEDEARRQAEIVVGVIDNEAKLADLQAPSAEELARLERLASRPAARPGESIGLTLERRGYWEGEAIEPSPEEV